MRSFVIPFGGEKGYFNLFFKLLVTYQRCLVFLDYILFCFMVRILQI